ncbi:MAG: O-methyltransferase [Betaproteobacteria bacterium]|nr:MAG: O-methyltransferase [Betaproteobacteria bacterium]
MSASVEALKAELERFGKENDAAKTARAERMLNITRDTGELLSVLARAMAARRILEIGTSNGYSTLWLAEAAKATGGKVTTVEASQFKIDLAAANFARSGLASLIDLIHDDAGRFLERARPGAFDLVFLDSERSEYPRWWPRLDAALRPGGLLVVDNASSHAAEIAPLVALVGGDPRYETCMVPAGNGEYLAVKSA